MIVLIAMATVCVAAAAWRCRLLRAWQAIAVLAIAAIALALAISLSAYQQKVLGTLIMPAGLIWMALFALSVHAACRGRARHAVGVGAVFVMFSLSGSAWLGTAALAILERQSGAVMIESMPSVDALCVLGGGTSIRPDGVAQSSAWGDRLLVAVQAHRLGRAPVLVASGAPVPGFRPRDYAGESAALWRTLGIAQQAIIEVRDGRTTSEEMASFAALGKQQGWTRIGVLSSAWHLVRARRHIPQGLDVVFVGCDWQGLSPEPLAIYLIPQPLGFSRIATAMWETVGMIAGR